MTLLLLRSFAFPLLSVTILLAGCAGTRPASVTKGDGGSDASLQYQDFGPSWEAGKWLGDGVALDSIGQGDGPLGDAKLTNPDAKPPADAAVLPPDSGCARVKEQLDGKDNNCNGQVDEGFWAVMKNGVSYAVLAGEHPSCRSSTAFSDACMAAAHRRCRKLGYSGGFGPVEFGPSSANIVCLADATLFTVNISELTKRHSGCTASTIFSLYCNSAIHRTCAARGFRSGVGPVEHSQIVAAIICTRHAKVLQVAFNELATYHSGCRANRSFTPDCHAAINRYCSAKGYRSGNGPVEQSKSAWVACLNQR